MIVSEIVEIKKCKDNIDIENALKSLGIDPIRWAVVEVLEDKFNVSVSYADV